MLMPRNLVLWRGIGTCFLALSVLLWTAYNGAEQILQPARSGGDAAGASSMNRSSNIDNPNRQYQISQIIQAHLFGKAQEPTAKRVVQAPETRLRLNLQGLIASGDKRFARAIINVNGAKADSYSIGQDIKGTDASLYAVRSERVLLKRGNAVESLVLKRESIANRDN